MSRPGNCGERVVSAEFSKRGRRPGGFAIGKEDGDFDMGILITAVENTDSIVAHQWPAVAGAARRNVTIGNYQRLCPAALFMFSILQ